MAALKTEAEQAVQGAFQGLRTNETGRLSEVPKARWKQLKEDLPSLVARLPPAAPNQLARVTEPAGPTSLETIMAYLHRDGAVIIEDAVSPEVCDATMRELGPYLEVCGTGENAWLGERTKRLSGIVARSKTSWDLCAHPLVLDVVAGVVGNQLLHEKGPGALGNQPFHLSVGQLIQIHPGEPVGPLHRDRPPILDLMPDFEPQLSTSWALADVTMAQGPTRVVIGSHRWAGDHPAPAEEMVAHATMRKGSLLLYASSSYHGGGANASASPGSEGLPRNAVFFTYNHAILTQEENQYVSCPVEVARDLPEKIQNLIGYTKIYGGWGFGPNFPESPKNALQPGRQAVNWASDWQAKGPVTDWAAQGVPNNPQTNSSKL